MFAERETSGERPPPGFCSHNVLPLESLPLAEHFLNQIAMYSFMCTQLLQSFHAPLVRPQGHPSRPTLEFSALWSTLGYRGTFTSAVRLTPGSSHAGEQWRAICSWLVRVRSWR
ncbi:hypothetical protein AcV5_008007 [Taiwanofungus camphoratus]|nr:hypothetical protein AcV5_008007 [Antrodia cinnamomea]